MGNSSREQAAVGIFGRREQGRWPGREAEAMASAGVSPDLLAMQQQMAAKFLEGRGAGAGQTAVAAPDVADQLSKLADLRDRGVLTDAEFQQQKAKLLGNP
jgi:hypothetical protein